jgi:hypothetical protein
LAATNSDIDTTDSQHEASAAAVNEEAGRPKRKKRKPTRQMSEDESAEDSEGSDSDLEDGDDDVQPAVPAGLCAEKSMCILSKCFICNLKCIFVSFRCHMLCTPKICYGT